MAHAPALEALYKKYDQDGFIVISLMGENSNGGTPSRADLQSWANQLGVTHPVLADPNWEVTTRYLRTSSIYLPTESLLGPGAEVIKKDTDVRDSDVRNALP